MPRDVEQRRGQRPAEAPSKRERVVRQSTVLCWRVELTDPLNKSSKTRRTDCYQHGQLQIQDEEWHHQCPPPMPTSPTEKPATSPIMSVSTSVSIAILNISDSVIYICVASRNSLLAKEHLSASWGPVLCSHLCRRLLKMRFGKP